MMKAVVNDIYGSPEVLELREVEIPEIKDDEILFKVFASSVNTLDIFFRRGIKVFFGLARLITGIRKPKRKILGFDFSGEVVEIGKNITSFNIGDQVFGGAKSGANAEFVISSETAIALKPKNTGYSEAAAMPMAALSALQALRDVGNIQKGQNILIYGASGGIGTYSIQLAKIFGATVTAVASGKNKELVIKLGADIFIDYTKEDFTDSDVTYDLIFDAVGKMSLSNWKKALKDDGIFVNAGSPSMHILRFYMQIMGNIFRAKKIKSFDTKYKKEDLELLASYSEEGRLISVIDALYSLDQVIEAHKHYETGHTAGKVIIKIREDGLSLNA